MVEGPFQRCGVRFARPTSRLQPACRVRRRGSLCTAILLKNRHFALPLQQMVVAQTDAVVNIVDWLRESRLFQQ
jgi:hypothetical protein